MELVINAGAVAATLGQPDPLDGYLRICQKHLDCQPVDGAPKPDLGAGGGACASHNARRKGTGSLYAGLTAGRSQRKAKKKTYSTTSSSAPAPPVACWPTASSADRDQARAADRGRPARHDYHWIHIPVGYLYCIGNPRTDWLYKTEPDAGLNGRSLRYPRGKTLGGCSSINGMIYMRGQARDYDQWAQLTGDEAWPWQAALPDFMAHEDSL